VQRIDNRNHRVTGDLTIKGVTKPVTVDFELTVADDRFGSQRIDVDGKAVVNRKDWGVKWNAALEGGGIFVGNKVPIEFKVSAVRTADDS
jgi:polyisoprenoid-binding protein YceI